MLPEICIATGVSPKMKFSSGFCNQQIDDITNGINKIDKSGYLKGNDIQVWIYTNNLMNQIKAKDVLGFSSCSISPKIIGMRYPLSEFETNPNTSFEKVFAHEFAHCKREIEQKITLDEKTGRWIKTKGESDIKIIPIGHELEAEHYAERIIKKLQRQDNDKI